MNREGTTMVKDGKDKRRLKKSLPLPVLGDRPGQV